jgi:uncharacterized protein YkwD
MQTTSLAVFFAAALASIVDAAVPANSPQLMVMGANAERAIVNFTPLCANSTPTEVTSVPMPTSTTVTPTPAATIMKPTSAPTTVMLTPTPTTTTTPTLVRTPTPASTAERSANATAQQRMLAAAKAKTKKPAKPGKTIQQRMLAAVNAERAKAGKLPLCTNLKLQKAAQLHSKDQAAKNFMDHKGSNGSTMQARVTAQKFNWNSLAENVAAGQPNVAAVMVSWMNSPGHKTNIMGDFKYFGMGLALNAKGTYKHYWTQVFGKGSGEACVP